MFSWHKKENKEIELLAEQILSIRKAEFFQGKFDILPVVIKYKNATIDPTFRWYEGEHPFVGLYKILLDGKCEVITDVMDLVSCDQSMSVEEYRDYVYNLMNSRYDEL